MHLNWSDEDEQNIQIQIQEIKHIQGWIAYEHHDTLQKSEKKRLQHCCHDNNLMQK
jgi:hypothetical protein